MDLLMISIYMSKWNKNNSNFNDEESDKHDFS